MSIDDEILKALSNVDDPDLHKDIVTLGMVKNLSVKDNKVKFDVVLTTPACPMKDMIEKACRTAISHLVSPTLEVDINMTSNVTTNRKSGDVLPGVKNIIAISSGKGGVGKSTFAANIARALRSKGASVGLLDADIYGPSVPTLFGIYDETPEMITVEGKNMMKPIEKEGISILSIGFFVKPEEAIAWRGPMISSALKQFLNDVIWGELDYLIIDLPPGTGDIQITLSQMVSMTGTVVITTPQPVAMADARRAIAMFSMPGVNIKVLGIVENMAWFSPPETPDKKYYIFGKNGGQVLANEFSVPLLGQVPIVESIRENSDSGSSDALSLHYFSEIAENLAQQISIHNKNQATAQ